MQFKNKPVTFLLISILALMISGCTNVGAASSWPGFSVQDDAGYLSFGAQTYAIDLKNGSLIWKYPAELDRTRQAYSAPQAVNGIVVFGDYSNNLVAVNAESGTETWRYTGAQDRYVAPVAASDSMVYAPNTDGYVYVLNSDGDLEWKFKTAGPNWSKPVIDAQTLLYASMDHFLYAIDLISSPTELELDKDGSRTLRTDFLWKTDLGMAVIADPVVEDGIVYVATIEGKLFAVEANSGQIVWSFDNGGDLGAIWGSPVIDDSVIFFADINGDVYTVEKGTGKQFWPSPFNAGGGIVGGGVKTNDGIVFATDEGKLFIINQEKEPKTLASFENAIYSPLSIYGENVLVAPASEEGLLSAYDLEGFEEWSFVPAE